MASEPEPYNLWEVAARNAAAMTASGQEPRRHNLVPRFYIERWAVDDRVRVTDLLRGRNAFELSPNRAATETCFYRDEEGAFGGSPVCWETWHSEVEGQAAAVLKHIDQHGVATMDEESQ